MLSVTEFIEFKDNILGMLRETPENNREFSFELFEIYEGFEETREDVISTLSE
jgi:hypothetical protein